MEAGVAGTPHTGQFQRGGGPDAYCSRTAPALPGSCAAPPPLLLPSPLPPLPLSLPLPVPPLPEAPPLLPSLPPMTMAGATGPVGLANSLSAAAAAAEASGDTLPVTDGVGDGTAERAAEAVATPLGIGDAGVADAVSFPLASPLPLVPFPQAPAPGEPLIPAGALFAGDGGLEGAVTTAPALLLALAEARPPPLPAGCAEGNGDDDTLAVDTGDGVADDVRANGEAEAAFCEGVGVAEELCGGVGAREKPREGDGVTDRLRDGGAPIVPPHPITTG